MSHSTPPANEPNSTSTLLEEPGVPVAKKHHVLVRWGHWLNASDFGDEGRAFRTRQALGAGSVVDRACMAVADQDSGCGGCHVTARNESSPVLGQPGQHALFQRRLRQLHESFGVEVHTQDG